MLVLNLLDLVWHALGRDGQNIGIQAPLNQLAVIAESGKVIPG